MRLFVLCVVFFLVSPSATDKQQSKPAEQQAATENTANQSSPVTVVVNQPSTEENRNRAKQKPEDGPPIYSNWALVIVAAFAAFAGLRTLHFIRMQAESTEKAANAANDNARAVINAERAWVTTELTWDHLSPKIAYLRSSEPDKVSESISVNVLLTCSNDGKSLAWITEKWAIMKAFNIIPLQPEFTNKESLFQRSMQPLVPNKSESNGHRIWLSVPGTDADRARVTIVIYGYVRYRTIFEREGETRFGYVLTRGDQLERLPADYPEYNRNT
jgi:hypothetical protein